MKFSRVAILLATYNSENYLTELLNSLKSQQKVEFHIFISDDNSTDETLSIVKKKLFKNEFTIIKNKERLGSPGLNFYNLVCKAPSNYEYYAFADHDDIWLENKLCIGIKKLNETKSEGYSSGYYPYYNNGKHGNIVLKSQNLKEIDFLFSSPGPGCTFILSQKGYKSLKKEVISNPKLFMNCEYHDWAIYAYFRSINLKWYIDLDSFIFYRQHSSNDTGANIGIRAKLKRIKMFLNGKLSFQIKNIVNLVRKYNPNCIENIKKKPLFDFYIYLLKNSRRKNKDSIVITILFFIKLLDRKKIF